MEEEPKPKEKPAKKIAAEPPVSLEEKDAFKKKLFNLKRHVTNVNENAAELAARIIDTAKSKKDLEFARQLVQKVRSHDLSKFSGIEWDHLTDKGNPLFETAMKQHQAVNDHHPEYYVGGIHEMGDLALGELVCDWKARSAEMGTDLRTYIKDVATARYKFSLHSNVYKTIKKFVDLLLDGAF